MAKEPFLTIFTRTCKRPVMLSDLIRWILKQSDQDIEQIFCVDRSGNHPEGNVLWANNQIPKHASRVDGEYVYFQDDDKAMIFPYFVAELKALVKAEHLPEVVLVRSMCATKEIGSMHFLPLPDVWNVEWEKGKRPGRWAGHALDYVVRADYWKKHIGAYIGKTCGGDCHFGTALISDRQARIVRLDRVVSVSLQRGKGQKFEQCQPGWFERVAKEFGIENLGTADKEDWRLRLWKR